MRLISHSTPLDRIALRVFAGLTWAFLVLPILILFPLSFTSASYLTFPPPGYSLKWLERYWSDEGWVDATIRSLEIGGATAVLSLLIGTLLAFGLTRTKFTGQRAIEGGISAPIVVPHIVFSIAIYGVFSSFGIIGEWYGVALAHTVLALPFVVIVLTAGMRDFDRSLELAAMGLGASQLRAIRYVTLPLLFPSLVSAAFMAFITSFDEIVVAMFLSGANMTLPKKMFDTILTGIEPTVAVASVLQIVVVTIALLLVSSFGRTTSVAL